MRRLLFSCVALGMAAGVSGAQAQTPRPDTTAAPAARDSAALVHPWVWRGAPETEGATLQLFEVARDSAEGRLRVHYKALALGLTPGERVAIWAFPLGPALGTCLLSGFVADSTGRLICDARSVASADSCARCTLPLDQIVLAATGYAPAEPYRAGVVSRDGTKRLYAEAYPIPVQAASDSLRVRLEMLTPDALTYQVVGEGFPEGDSVGLVTRSLDRSMTSKMVVPPGGRFRLAVYPKTPNERGGHASLTLDSGKHHLTLEWPWGETALSSR